jgi:hypothetical protein
MHEQKMVGVELRKVEWFMKSNRQIVPRAGLEPARPLQDTGF